MKKALVVCVLLAFCFVMFGFGEDLKYELDKKVTGLKLKDLDGKEFDLEKVLKQDDVKGVVFSFISYQCPGSIAYDSRYVEYTDVLAKKGILFIGVASNYNDTIEDFKKYSEKKGFNFPILVDKGNVIADRFSATKTPHVFFVDKKGTLIYKGAIDDNRTPSMVKNRVLENVADEYLSGKKLSVKETAPFG
ncbi:MAG: redoxin domain-containing protein [bacterium]|nr:redoxin domain-containing protein [bacterium]